MCLRSPNQIQFSFDDTSTVLFYLKKKMFISQLIIGDFGLSFEQSRTQFALWSIMASVSELELCAVCDFICVHLEDN